jgi:hypothetical protein
MRVPDGSRVSHLLPSGSALTRASTCCNLSCESYVTAVFGRGLQRRVVEPVSSDRLAGHRSPSGTEGLT